MAIKVLYQSRKCDPAFLPDGSKRYVRKTIKLAGQRAEPDYFWCVTDRQSRRDVQQGTCDASDLPQGVREAADKLAGQVFSYVEWPQ